MSVLKESAKTVPISKFIIAIMLVGAVLIGFLFGLIYRESVLFAQEQNQLSTSRFTE